jgi:hypothetical protein
MRSSRESGCVCEGSRSRKYARVSGERCAAGTHVALRTSRASARMYGRRWGESDSAVTIQVVEGLLPRSKLHKHIDLASRRIGVSRSPEAR